MRVLWASIAAVLLCVGAASEGWAIRYELRGGDVSVLDISGTASDNVGVASVTWSDNLGRSGLCDGTESWSATGIELSEGAKTVTVTAADFAGNKGSATVDIEPLSQHEVYRYYNSFSGPNGSAGPEWSAAQGCETAGGSKKLLGFFGGETVTLNLGSLPVHSYVSLSVELLVEGAIGAAAGWTISADGSELPGGRIAAAGDAVRRVDFTFAHTSRGLQVDISPTGFQGAGWGIDSITVTASADAPVGGG